MLSPPDKENNDYSVFVSYASADREWVLGYLLNAFDQAQISYRNEEAFELGTPMIEAIEHAVTNRRVVVVFSHAYMAERWSNVLGAITQSIGEETGTWPLIPVVLDDVALPARIRMLERIDLSDQDDWGEGINRLCETLGGPLPEADSREVPQCPFPGMRPFRGNQHDLFFGRDIEIQQITELLRVRPLVTVIGPSGSGKSSLILAGVAPGLDGHTLFDGDEWQTRVVRPGASLFDQLASTFDVAADTTPAALAAAISAAAGDGRVLLVIDQLEEMLAEEGPNHVGIGRPEEEATNQASSDVDIASVLVALEQYERVRVVITARADFYGKLMDSALWPRVKGSLFEVPPLRDRALRNALVEPAERVGVYVEAALVERLLRDAADEPGLMPFIQETMVTLWGRIERRLLTLSGYEALVLSRAGYETVGRTGLQVAIARHADAVMDRLDDAQRAVARRLFLRLTQFGEGRAHSRRRQFQSDLVTVSDSPEVFTDTVAILTKERLLTKGSAHRDTRLAPTIDLSHEALITGWPRLTNWIDDRREAETIRRRLADQASEWKRLGSTTAGLLDATQLAIADRWRGTAAAADLGVAGDIAELLDASRRKVRRGQVVRSGVTIALATLLLIAVAGVVYATLQQRTARSEANRALSLLLARAAVDVPDEDVGLGLLLAIEGRRRVDTADARGALRTALERTPELVTLLGGHDVEVFDVAVSPRGDQFTTVGRGPTAIVWDAAALTPLFELPGGHTEEIMTVAYDPSGTTIATGSRDGTVNIWDADTGEEAAGFATFSHATAPTTAQACRENGNDADDIRALEFNPQDPDVLAIGGHNRLVEIWNIASLERVGVLAGHACDVMTIAWHPEGTVLASAGRDDTIRLWDVAGGTETRRLGAESADGEDTTGDIRSIAFNRTGSRIAVGSNDQSVRLFDTATGKQVWTRTGHTQRVFDVAFAPDDTSVVSAGRDQRILTWDNDDGAPLGAPLVAHRGSVRALEFLPSGRLVSVSNDSFVAIWELDRRFRLGGILPSLEQTATAIAASGATFTMGTADGSIVTLDRNHVPSLTSSAHSDRVVDIVALADGGTASLGADGSVAVVAGESVARTWPSHPAQSRPAAMASVADTNLLATGDASGLVLLWDVTTGSAVGRPLHVPECELLDIAASAKDVLAVTCNTGPVWLWRIANGETGIGSLEIDSARVSELAFSPSGDTLVGATVNGELRVWGVTPDPPSLTQGSAPNVGGEETNVVAIDPTNPARFASGSQGGEVYLWDLDTGQTIGSSWRLPASIRSLAFSADGAELAAAIATGAVYVFDVDEQDWMVTACSVAGRAMTVEEWKRYVAQGPLVASCA